MIGLDNATILFETSFFIYCYKSDLTLGKTCTGLVLSNLSTEDNTILVNNCFS